MAASQAWWEPPPTPPPADGSTPNLEFEKLNVESVPDPATEELLTRRVHILGTGSIGTLVAHSLAILPNPPPITLLLHRSELYEDFKTGKRIVRLVNKNTEVNDEQTGFDVDVCEPAEQGHFWRHISDTMKEDPDHPPSAKNPLSPVHPPVKAEKMETGEVFIYTLIVTVKGPATVTALDAIKHRVDSRTTILLMQNGFGSVALGIYRDTDKYPLPPKDDQRPIADLPEADRKALYPTDADLYSNLSSRYLLRTLTRSPVLACAAYPYLDLFQLQLEKLVANSILNPLTALLDVENGAMLNNPALRRVRRLLLAEISIVIRSLPELEGIPNAQLRFSPNRLENFYKAICRKTAKNSSSMREDLRHAKYTEIDYINGYIVKRGEELGIKCVLNYMVMQLVKGKSEYLFQTGLGPIPKDISEQATTEDGETVVLEDLGGRQIGADDETQTDTAEPKR
ncbi:2-dehydropantoate 2-reductase (Ketopantoate reductase) (KPA reductase) (KPR) [Lithohypha guttulata]|uniref:2-dehydropantoate 2-reductase (Ketopantoate reductase) (KPA reductase) (KPR) n=1 Tax=Lithohypha guttulata TaxID=1690604 RepID=A0AAN7SYE6_9EURO|nr:2-dehydropantoate 2-reductase (Ketopantoate reductase) (KPA reductase) (KPR) [Lithohypha guttulata]